MKLRIIPFLIVLLFMVPFAAIFASARAVNINELSSSEGETEKLEDSASEAGDDSTDTMARSSEDVIQPGANVTESKGINQNPNEYWTEELDATLALACDWLSISKQGKLSYLCLGTAGEPAPAQLVTKYISDVSLTEEYENILDLEYAILNTTFCGYNAENILGNNLIKPIKRYAYYEKESLYTIAYALLALDCNQYSLEKDSHNSRDSLTQLLLARQNADGGFSAYPEQNSTPTQTALALVALADYRQDQPTCQLAVQNGISYLASMQQEDGTYLDGNKTSSTAVSKVLTALIVLDIPLDDERFVKSGETIDEVLLGFTRVDGGFGEARLDDSDVVATENAILALSALKNEKNPYQLMFYLENAGNSFENVTSSADTGVTIQQPVMIGILAGAVVIILLALVVTKKMINRHEEAGETQDGDTEKKRS